MSAFEELRSSSIPEDKEGRIEFYIREISTLMRTRPIEEVSISFDERFVGVLDNCVCVMPGYREIWRLVFDRSDFKEKDESVEAHRARTGMRAPTGEEIKEFEESRSRGEWIDAAALPSGNFTVLATTKTGAMRLCTKEEFDVCGEDPVTYWMLPPFAPDTGTD